MVRNWTTPFASVTSTQDSLRVEKTNKLFEVPAAEVFGKTVLAILDGSCAPFDEVTVSAAAGVGVNSGEFGNETAILSAAWASKELAAATGAAEDCGESDVKEGIFGVISETDTIFS